MSKKEKEVNPHIIEPFKSGNTIIRRYEEWFEDIVGNTSVSTYVDFTDKKGKLNERFLLYVNWMKNKTELVGKEKSKFIENLFNPITELDNDYYDGYLNYYFKHNNSIFLAYIYESEVKNNKSYLSYMVFELTENSELSVDESATPFMDEGFEERMQQLYKKKMIKDYYFYTMYYDMESKFVNEKVYIGKKAKYLCHLYIDQYTKIEE